MKEFEHIVMLRDSLNRMLDDQVPPAVAAAWDKEDRIPREVLQPMAQLGICGVAVPEAYGGEGVDVRAVVAVIEELARRSAVLSGLYVQNTIYGSFNVAACGTEEQKRALLPKLARGELLFSYGLSEPNVGADLASVETRAERRGDRMVINGNKRWCSGADVADYIYTLVRSGPALEAEKLQVPAMALGIGQCALDEAWAYAQERRQCHVRKKRIHGVHFVAQQPVGVPGRWCVGWAHVAAGAERRSRAGHQQHTYRLVSVNAPDSFAQFLAHAHVDGVSALGPAQNERGHAIGDYQGYRFEIHFRFSMGCSLQVQADRDNLKE